MSLLLTEADVRSLLTMPIALEAVEAAFRRLADGTAILHPRMRIQLPDKAFLHYMAAADTQDGYMGLKIYTYVRGALRFLVLLYRAKTGELAAIVEADYLGQMRTGAASGVATKYMARADARAVGIVGTGLQARTQLEAIAAVRQIELVRAFGRNPERRAQFAHEMSKRLGVPIQPVSSAEQAVREVDIVVTATNSSSAVVQGLWLAPGAHINAIGANFPQKRELDDEAVRRAGIIAVDSREQSKVEAGDLIHTLGADSGRWSSVRELSEIVGACTPGRTDARQITLFKSNGIAIEDVAAAARVYEMAGGGVGKGPGQRLSLWEHCG